MDWPTQTRAISTIHSVLREQAKVYPADTIVYPVATIHSMKSLLEKEHKYYLEFTLSKSNFMENIKKIKEPSSFHFIVMPTSNGCEGWIQSALFKFGHVILQSASLTIRCHSDFLVATTCK